MTNVIHLLMLWLISLSLSDNLQEIKAKIRKNNTFCAVEILSFIQ